MEKNFALRASDFRKNWADAYAAAIHEGWLISEENAQTMRAHDLITARLDKQLRTVIALPPLLLEMQSALCSVHATFLERSTAEFSAKIEGTLEKLLTERTKLDESREAMNAQWLALSKAQTALDESQAKFKDRGFWSRVFNQV